MGRNTRAARAQSTGGLLPIFPCFFQIIGLFFTGAKSWKRHYSPQRYKSSQLRRKGRSPGHGRRYRISNRLQKTSLKYRDEELPCIDDDIDLSDTDQQSEEESFCWDEEQTLFSDLMEGADYKVDDSEDWIELLESLQDAYQDNSVALKKETASAFVPTAMRLKKCLRLCDEQDRKYGEGILMLNSTLKKHELLVIKMEDEMKEAYSLAQNRIDMTVKQLEEAYSHRDKLWSRFHENIAQIGEIQTWLKHWGR
ncbi:hypothetical protein JOM56_003354 [Amanita muscaria]